MRNKVGLQVYEEPTVSDFDAVHNQMELKIAMFPYKVISDVSWDIKREKSRVYWYTPLSEPKWDGKYDWAADDPPDTDEDLAQEEDCKRIFVIDAPGRYALYHQTGYTFTYKAKFREWVEVKVGDNWYVCSPYKQWRSIIHSKYDDVQEKWIYDTSKTNEICPGTIDGFAGSWSED